MEAREEIRITVKADYRDIVKAVVIEAARLLYKRGVDVKGFKAKVKLVQDERGKPKTIISFTGEENVELMISGTSPIDIERDEPVDEPVGAEPEAQRNVAFDTGMYEHLSVK